MSNEDKQDYNTKSDEQEFEEKLKNTQQEQQGPPWQRFQILVPIIVAFISLLSVIIIGMSIIMATNISIRNQVFGLLGWQSINETLLEQQSPTDLDLNPTMTLINQSEPTIIIEDTLGWTPEPTATLVSIITKTSQPTVPSTATNIPPSSTTDDFPNNTPCKAYTEDAVPIHLGPGQGRYVRVYMPKHMEINIVNKYYNPDEEALWYSLQLDKPNSRWVEGSKIETSGNCDNVPIVDATPIINTVVPLTATPIPPNTPTSNSDCPLDNYDFNCYGIHINGTIWDDSGFNADGFNIRGFRRDNTYKTGTPLDPAGHDYLGCHNGDPKDCHSNFNDSSFVYD